MMDILAEMFAMTEEFDAGGKKWLTVSVVKSVKGGAYVLAAEVGAELPASVYLVLREHKEPTP